jgi:hypothetical protein
VEVLVAEPVAGKDPDGNAVTQLLIVIADPDSGKTRERLMCEIEVPDDVAERYGKKLRAGDSVLVTGQLSDGDGGIVAAEINPGWPPGEGPTGGE